MKIIILAVGAFIVASLSCSNIVSGAVVLNKEQQQQVEGKQEINKGLIYDDGPLETLRHRKSASYGGGCGAACGGVSIPVPPCPKNYLISCESHWQSLPCAAAASAPSYNAPSNDGSSYGASSAHSAPSESDSTYSASGNTAPSYSANSYSAPSKVSTGYGTSGGYSAPSVYAQAPHTSHKPSCAQPY